jgi:N-acetylglutamate synthase-like GNAT family acetyltransferase
VAGFAEKDFYLEEFRGKAIVFSVDRPLLRSQTARNQLTSVCRDLLRGGARVVVVLGGATDEGAPRANLRTRSGPGLRWRRWLGLPPTRAKRSRRTPGAALRSDVVSWRGADDSSDLVDLWWVLRARSMCLVLCDGDAEAVACQIAAGFRVTKLVLLDRAGGLMEKKRGRKPLSYLDGSSLDALLAAGEAEFQGFGHRRDLLTRIDAVLEKGVSSVNLCRVSGLARELFTYEGAGTFFSRDDHYRVDPLSIEDFDEVERLVARGQKEGLLRRRTADEIAEILLDGFGVWLAGGHLAGIGSLRTWETPEGPLGEIVALYTFTRFKGEGIGGRLIKRLLSEARAQKMPYVFAVTTSDRAARFFVRNGFDSMRPTDAPAAKWADYDSTRRSRARVFRFDLS